VPLQNALLFMGYGVGERMSGTAEGSASILPIFLGGCVGGFVQSFVVAPAELLKAAQHTTTTKQAHTVQ
jgi:solute carrier family 25 carnitine/acylcarnitine transporter 20/29